MYGKLIKCDVSSGMKSKFSVAQECWIKTNEANGFIKQLGGWDQDEAVIFALWKDKSSAQHFMRTLHDSIALMANQTEAYSNINVSYLDHVMDIPAYSHSTSLEPDFLRIADCTIIEGKESEFIELQKNVWNKGMSEIKGMLGGYVWRFENEPQRYLVTTLWETEVSHEAYMRNHFPKLLSASSIGAHIRELSGHAVGLERKWGFEKVK